MRVSPHDPIFLRLREACQRMWLHLGMIGADVSGLAEAMQRTFKRRSVDVFEFIEAVFLLRGEFEKRWRAALPLLRTTQANMISSWYMVESSLVQHLLNAAVTTIWLDPEIHTKLSASLSKTITTASSVTAVKESGAHEIPWITYQELADATFPLALAVAGAHCQDQQTMARVQLTGAANQLAAITMRIATEAEASPSVLVLGTRRAHALESLLKWLNASRIATLLALRKLGCNTSRYERAMNKLSRLLEPLFRET